MSALHTDDLAAAKRVRHWTECTVLFSAKKLPARSAATQSESLGRIPPIYLCTTIGCFQFTELQKTVVLNTAFCCNILPRDAQKVYACCIRNFPCFNILPDLISSLLRQAAGNCLISITSRLKLVPELEAEKSAGPWSACHKQHRCDECGLVLSALWCKSLRADPLCCIE